MGKGALDFALELVRPLAFLAPDEIDFIDRLLDSLGEYGEVRLVVAEGRLRTAFKTVSCTALRLENAE